MDSGCRTGSKGEREGEKSEIELSVIVVRERELSVSVCESVCVRACVVAVPPSVVSTTDRVR